MRGIILLLASLSAWTPAQEEQFLLTARIENAEAVDKGVSHSQKVTLTDGRRTHTAHVQTIDIYKPLFKAKDGSEEREFKDSYKFNIAAYRLSKLLHLDYMVPVSVMRTIDGKPASIDWWIDDVLMDERERLSKNIQPPDIPSWNRAMDTIRVFDQLIYNMDRSQENLLITKDWKPWMIDHTRAFRKWPTLRDASRVTHASPSLYRALQQLRRSDVERELGPYLTAEEIEGLMVRRDIIVQKLSQPGAVR
jgi:hypothetical protein